MKNLKAYLLVIVFLAIAVWQGGTGLARYATPSEAIARGGRVQVMGTLVATEEGYYVRGECGGTVSLDILGGRNIRLDPGQQVVAIGQVKGRGVAVDRLLYKCPSKYRQED